MPARDGPIGPGPSGRTPPAGPGRSERRSRGCFGVFVAFAIVLATAVTLYALYAAVIGGPPQWIAEVTRCAQPDSVTYADGTYEVIVREQTGSVSLAQGDAYAMVSRVGLQGSYGVVVDLNTTTEGEQVTCRWQAGQVEIVEPSGIVHTVPAEVFTGGR